MPSKPCPVGFIQARGTVPFAMGIQGLSSPPREFAPASIVFLKPRQGNNDVPSCTTLSPPIRSNDSELPTQPKGSIALFASCRLPSTRVLDRFLNHYRCNGELTFFDLESRAINITLEFRYH